MLLRDKAIFKEKQNMKAAIVGMGLIGGSFAKAFKEKTDFTVYGENRSREVLEKAMAAGAIDDVLDDEKLSQCDLVVVALYPKRLIEWLESHAKAIAKNAVIIDTCGVKQAVCAPCCEIAKKHGFTFIGAHPMAGKENWGSDAADENLFNGASLIVMKDKLPEKYEKFMKHTASNATCLSFYRTA